MKKSSILSFVLLFMLLATTGFSQEPIPTTTDDTYYQPDESSQSANDPYSYEEFYDELAPHGSWVNYPRYGYVWIPRVSSSFHPYATEGHWVMTNYGWTWVSDYRWGWAAFHYGRWAFEPRFGWMWIPGRKWGPAWVAWRESDDYFGWAPLGPYGVVSINVGCPYDHYRFVQRRYFTNRNVYNYYSDSRQNVTIINRTRYINETHIVNNNKYFYGPRRDYVERAVGTPIREAKITERLKPDADFVDNDNVKVYRPRFEDKSPAGSRKPTPKIVVNVTDLQPISTERRLTQSVKMEKPQNIEGTSRDNREGGQRPQKQPRREEMQGQPDVTRQQMPNTEARPQRQPRREDAPQANPYPTKQQMPNNESRPQRQPRREEAPQANPYPTKQQMPNNESRPQRQPRREEAPQANPYPTKQQMPNNESRPQRQPRREEGVQQAPNTQPKMEQPRKERTNQQPTHEKPSAPQGKKNRGDNDL